MNSWARLHKMKLWDRDSLLAWREELRRAELKLVFTNGCFDLIHVGHVRLLEKAAGYGDRLIVALNSDESIGRLKGPQRPFVPLSERAEIIGAFGAVDRVMAFDEDTPLQIITLLTPDVFGKGGDWAHHQVVRREKVESTGGRVEIVSFLSGRSTTEMVEKIRNSRS